MKPLHADSSTPTVSSSQYPAPGLAQILGLHPAIATLTVAVDFLMFTEEVITMGFGYWFSVAVSCAVGFLAFKGQQAWYGDSKDSAMTKAGILALLTAIPSPLFACLYLPAGAIGFFRQKG